MATTNKNKKIAYRYKITTPEELREAKWLIEQGDFKDMDDYIDSLTRAELRYKKTFETSGKRKKVA